MLVIYHVEGRRSERVVWLCEEIGLAYDLKFAPGDLLGSLKAGREVNPLMPMFPTVVYDGEVLVESVAILQLLHERHGEGRLAPAPACADYPKYLQWLHFAEGSAAPRFITEFLLTKATQGELPPLLKGQMGRSALVLAYLDDHLSRRHYFGGAAFSLADIMMHFPVSFVSMVARADLSAFPHVAAWFATVEDRPAFKRMREASLPNGFIGVPS
ncbi:MAG TPA: glutathione S-transferase family protein [Caulobacteraceae bacterium]|jgi:glutathione S-transferase